LDTNKQTDRQTDKPNLYIDRNCILKVCGFLDCGLELQTATEALLETFKVGLFNTTEST